MVMTGVVNTGMRSLAVYLMNSFTACHATAAS